jgi:xanthosine utilization system XapX-like protein
MSWLEQLAPTIASAVGGPLVGLAYEAVAKALGTTPDDAQKMLATGKLTSDQLASIQQAEIALKAQAQSMNLDFARLTNDDRKSARDLQSTTRSIIPPALALLVTIGFFGILVGMMTESFKTSEALMLMLGSLGTAWTGIIAFYFGSSAGSQAKDSLIHKSTPI